MQTSRKQEMLCRDINTMSTNKYDKHNEYKYIIMLELELESNSCSTEVIS